MIEIMREILFRGKRIDNGEWVYGNLIKEPNGTTMIDYFVEDEENTGWHKRYRETVDPETISQYTGAIDDNENKIFEEDFVRIDDKWNGRVIWRDDVTAFVVFPDDDINIETYCVGFYVSEMYKVEVIGNYYDNKELLVEEDIF